MRKLLFFTTLVLALSGCIKREVPRDCSERFSMQSHGQNFNSAIYVITDKQTGQEYLLVKCGYGCELAPLITQK